MKEEKPLIEKFSHYEILGAVKIEAWGGGKGLINMSPITIFPIQNINLEDHKNCIQFLNDAGFGCKKYLAAFVNVWKVYDHGGRMLWYVDSFNLQNPNETVSHEDLEALENCIMDRMMNNC